MSYNSRVIALVFQIALALVARSLYEFSKNWITDNGFHSVACIPFPFRLIFSPFNESNFRCLFTKTIILLGLAEYEMIINNSGLRASLVIYHLIFGAP